MNTRHNHNKKWNNKIGIPIVFILLTLIGLIVFFLGKIYSAPEAQVESVKQEEMIRKQVDVQPTNDEPANRKVVYLTFDDGPSRLTNEFLDVLLDENIKATFFMQGNNLKKEHLQESVKRAIAEGHYIGGHSMTHAFQTLYSENQFVPEMSETLSLIEDITGTTPSLVRPPYGSAPGLESEQIRNDIVDVGMKVWDWTIDSNDWALEGNPEKIIETIKSETKFDVEVVLMHEKSQTLAVLPEIIAFYREQGYEFVVYDDAHHFELNFQGDIRL